MKIAASAELRFTELMSNTHPAIHQVERITDNDRGGNTVTGLIGAVVRGEPGHRAASGPEQHCPSAI
ncbi:hypothetical protein [Rhodococcus rhodochrous]|uniref:hypothetical protein n=1 Tax=Rhodococcus rhodochrous TaxID=1829 RepID=UPI001D009830|nr:hypothetical protein [Rhodococcus rhodochrous]